MKYYPIRDPNLEPDDWPWFIVDEIGQVVSRGYLTCEVAQYWAKDFELMDCERERDALVRLVERRIKDET